MQKLLNQSDKFNLDQTVVYLNGAYMSPQLNSVTDIGLQALKIKENPSAVGVDDFFETPLSCHCDYAME